MSATHLTNLCGALLTIAMVSPAAAREEPPPGGVLPPARQAQRVAVLRRPGCREYEKVAEELKGRIQAVVRLVPVVPDESKNHALVPWLKRFRPRMLVTIGQTAHDFAHRAELTPAVHTLVFNGPPEGQGRHLIPSRVPPTRILQTFRRVRKGIRRIAILHGPSSRAAREAAEVAAVELDLRLLPMPAGTPAEAIRLLRRISRKAQGLWLLTDLEILTPQVMQYALGIQFRRRVLLMGATRRHAEQGALLAVDYEPHSIGRRAAGVVNRYLAGDRRRLGAAPGAVRVTVNRGTAQTLRIPVAALKAAGAELVQ